MFDKETTKLLQKSLPDLSGKGLPLMVCNPSLKHDMDDLVAMALPGMSLAIIDDRNTAAALGDQLFRALGCTRVTQEGAVVADEEAVAIIRAKTKSCDALVATGSGTINDLCKYAAFLDGKPYIVFPTAASMNGYLSANASITMGGTKKTVAAQMPGAVFCDMSVIAAAPSRLAKSGLGDSLARPTAQADWLLSHLLLGTPYHETPFALLAGIEPHVFEQARGIAAGDMASIELLLKNLLLSGLGMTIAGGSYPASQGEHMIAHAYGMMSDHPLTTLHGEEIGVITLVMSRLQETLLRKKPTLRSQQFDMEKMTELFGTSAAADAKKAYRQKQEIIEQAAPDFSNWDDIAHQIAGITMPSEKIHAILKAANAPDMPEKLGWNSADFTTAVTCARFLRDRFTFLDVE